MATCRITEYSNLAMDSRGYTIYIGLEPSITVQNVTYTNSSQSDAFSGNTQFIRVDCDAEGHFSIGKNPEATELSTRLQADTPEYFGVRPGDKIAIYDGFSS